MLCYLHPVKPSRVLRVEAGWRSLLLSLRCFPRRVRLPRKSTCSRFPVLSRKRLEPSHERGIVRLFPPVNAVGRLCLPVSRCQSRGSVPLLLSFSFPLSNAVCSRCSCPSCFPRIDSIASGFDDSAFVSAGVSAGVPGLRARGVPAYIFARSGCSC